MMPQIKTVERTVKTRFVEVAGKWRFPVSQEVQTDQQMIAGDSQQEKSDGNDKQHPGNPEGLDRR